MPNVLFAIFHEFITTERVFERNKNVFLYFLDDIQEKECYVCL